MSPSVPPPFDVHQVAKLLGLTPQGVEKRVAKPDGLSWAPGTSRRSLEGEGVIAEVRKRYLALTCDLDVLRAEARRCGISLKDPTDAATTSGSEPSSRSHGALDIENQELKLELERERLGKAVAETRIDELKRQVRQANEAIRALQPQPDASLDLP